MKKILVILLSLLLFFNSSLFIILYSGLIFEATNDAKEKILASKSCSSDEDYTVIKLNKNDSETQNILGSIHNNEVVYNNSLFDIIYIENNSDTVNIYCFKDAKEDELFRILVTHFENEDSKTAQGGVPMQFFNILFSFLSNVIVPQVNDNFPVMTSMLVCLSETAKLRRGIYRIPAPPPKSLI